jgi:hypothetical protein
VEGFITIRLRIKHTPDSGSGLPDLGHDAYWLVKRIPEIEFKDANGKIQPIGEQYTIIETTTSAVAAPTNPA